MATHRAYFKYLNENLKTVIKNQFTLYMEQRKLMRILLRLEEKIDRITAKEKE